jgi:Methyltransferase domain
VASTQANAGCPCYHTSLFDSANIPGQFHLIILSHVWEHILDINAAMQVLASLLQPGGYIYIECPNAMHYKNFVHAPLQEFNTEHINHFFGTAFENLFGLHGYSKVDVNSKLMKLASGEDYDAVYGVFKKAEHPISYTLQQDKAIRPSIDAYIAKSSSILQHIYRSLDDLLAQNKPVALVGIGQFAFKLLAYPPLQQYPHLLLFDNNPLNVGKVIAGHVVLPGSQMTHRYREEPFSIVITSLIFEKEITAAINANFSQQSMASPSVISLQKYLYA